MVGRSSAHCFQSCARRVVGDRTDRSEGTSHRSTSEYADTSIDLSSRGNQGVVRTETILRENFWWTRIDKDVESFVGECYHFQLGAFVQGQSR